MLVGMVPYKDVPVQLIEVTETSSPIHVGIVEVAKHEDVMEQDGEQNTFTQAETMKP